VALPAWFAELADDAKFVYCLPPTRG